MKKLLLAILAIASSTQISTSDKSSSSTTSKESYSTALYNRLNTITATRDGNLDKKQHPLAPSRLLRASMDYCRSLKYDESEGIHVQKYIDRKSGDWLKDKTTWYYSHWKDIQKNAFIKNKDLEKIMTSHNFNRDEQGECINRLTDSSLTFQANKLQKNESYTQDDLNKAGDTDWAAIIKDIIEKKNQIKI